MKKSANGRFGGSVAGQSHSPAAIPAPQKQAIEREADNNWNHPILQRDAPDREFVDQPNAKGPVHLDILFICSGSA
jgi:hypothetical protein